MKKLLTLSIVVLSACLLIFSCGGGGGGGGGGAVSGGSSSKSAVVIGLDGLSMRSATRAAATSVWDTLTSVDLTVYVDDESVFNKVLTASDNVAVIEEVDVGSSVYATAIVTFNEANGGGTAEAKSETIEVQPGSNNLTLAITYKYNLIYWGIDGDMHEKTGTYTYASGIPLPEDFSYKDADGIPFFKWSSDGERQRVSYPQNLVGIRGNISLIAEYMEVPAGSFNVTYHFERNGATVSTPKVYTYSPPMSDAPSYAYTNDIMLVIDSCDTGIGDWYLESTGNPALDYCPTSDTSFLISAIDAAPYIQGEYILRKNDGSFSNQIFVVTKKDTIDVVDGCITSFQSPETGATDIQYIVNNPNISAIDMYAVGTLTGNIKSVDLSGTRITTIPNSCFKNCSALTYISFPDMLDDIEESAFEGCSKLDGIQIPANVVLIETNAFKDCFTDSSLSAGVCLYFAGESPLLGDSVFSGCTYLRAIYCDGPTFNFDNTMLPNTNENPFYQCTNLAELHLSAPTDITISSNLFYSQTGDSPAFIIELGSTNSKTINLVTDGIVLAKSPHIITTSAPSISNFVTLSAANTNWCARPVVVYEEGAGYYRYDGGADFTSLATQPAEW